MTRWQPWRTAPRDGSWIIAVCNDGVSIERVSWGRNYQGELAFCSDRSHYSEGIHIFKGWIPWPAFGEKESIDGHR